jgi:hypothetical protein
MAGTESLLFWLTNDEGFMLVVIGHNSVAIVKCAVV